MDSNIVIAVTGITSIVVGAIGTYFLQKRASERQRKWSLEDEEKRKGYEREAEQRSIKRELSSKRLDVLEESIKIMMNHISSAIDRELDVLRYDDTDSLREQGKRLQSIIEEAYAALVALDSKVLTENWKAISSAYWEAAETGTLSYKLWEKVRKAYVEIIRLTDEMRSQT